MMLRLTAKSNSSFHRNADVLNDLPKRRRGGVLPGEIEARNDARNRKEGLLLPANTLADLVKPGFKP